MPPHEILHHARGVFEAAHRKMIYIDSVHDPLHACVQRNQDVPIPDSACIDPDHANLAGMNIDEAETFCNKSVSIYVVPGALRAQNLKLFYHSLHNFLYHEWFEPYRSEIEYGQFIAKTVVINHLYGDMETELFERLVKSLNEKLCGYVERVQSDIRRFPSETIDQGRGSVSKSVAKTIRDQEFFILQPIFKALSILLLGENFNEFTEDVGKIPVYLIRTGLGADLSAPISFEPIIAKVDAVLSESTVQTSLGTAIDFVMELVARENAVFGVRPDPIQSTSGLQDGCLMGLETCLPQLRRLG